MGKLVLRKTILRNMIDRVWAALYLSGTNFNSNKENGDRRILQSDSLGMAQNE
jgi:hypothetical protein